MSYITHKTTIFRRKFVENVSNDGRVGVSDKGLVFRVGIHKTSYANS